MFLWPPLPPLPRNTVRYSSDKSCNYITYIYMFPWVQCRGPDLDLCAFVWAWAVTLLFCNQFDAQTKSIAAGLLFYSDGKSNPTGMMNNADLKRRQDVGQNEVNTCWFWYMYFLPHKLSSGGLFARQIESSADWDTCRGGTWSIDTSGICENRNVSTIRCGVAACIMTAFSHTAICLTDDKLCHKHAATLKRKTEIVLKRILIGCYRNNYFPDLFWERETEKERVWERKRDWEQERESCISFISFL